MHLPFSLHCPSTFDSFLPHTFITLSSRLTLLSLPFNSHCSSRPHPLVLSYTVSPPFSHCFSHPRRRYEMYPLCADLQGQILACYKENVGKTLNCSNIAALYLQCVNNAKQVRIYHTKLNVMSFGHNLPHLFPASFCI